MWFYSAAASAVFEMTASSGVKYDAANAGSNTTLTPSPPATTSRGRHATHYVTTMI